MSTIDKFIEKSWNEEKIKFKAWHCLECGETGVGSYLEFSMHMDQNHYNKEQPYNNDRFEESSNYFGE